MNERDIFYNHERYDGEESCSISASELIPILEDIEVELENLTEEIEEMEIEASSKLKSLQDLKDRLYRATLFRES